MKLERKHVWIIIWAITLLAIFKDGGSGANIGGFFSGIWHGWIAPIKLIMGIFDENVRIYQVANSGWLYDFGFYMAVISGFGGLSLSRRKRKKETA
ncbi:hypothetical protein [Clostridium ganghwense]|uniref:DUF2809 domain-containing protein n=1 Tax=Clostridium ganghwense TaxID=312089 RepID=A0ABT4CK03_9CLOT|nr:hypothetical protein [Clostridium ganghwense]MCY6369375.1 hypothetical protein [Clostridium ganghwense]